MPQLDTVLAQVDAFFARADAVADGETVKGPDGKSYPKGTRFIPIEGKVRPILPGNNVPRAADCKVDAHPIDIQRRKLSELKRRLGSASSGQQREMRAEIAKLESKIKGTQADAALAAADELFAKADAAATGRVDASGYDIYLVRFYVGWSRASVREYEAVARSSGEAERLAVSALKKDYGSYAAEGDFKITGTKKIKVASDYVAKTYGGRAANEGTFSSIRA